MRRASLGSVHNQDLDEQRLKLMQDLKDLYSCNPSLEILQRSWAANAEFEGPMTHAKGLNEIAAQWFVMVRLSPDGKVKNP